ncbi:hypothetical protein GCM10010246_18860 [Streptomyces cuspidosporus]|uniref:Uncharacterized protein n=1 Tax=Streptomyces cuspidosporus TaxID=66882 RepID=A0ABP5SN40_9ACTN
MTYHHNWFSNVYSRIPSLRFGTGHFYETRPHRPTGADSGGAVLPARRTLFNRGTTRPTKLRPHA